MKTGSFLGMYPGVWTLLSYPHSITAFFVNNLSRVVTWQY